MESFGPFLEQWSDWVPVPLFALLALLELTVGHGDAGLSPVTRVATNVSLYIVAAVVAFAMPLTIASAAAWAGRNGVGLFNTVQVPAVLVLTVAILARSFAAYWLHRASHRIPLLWRLHSIHHGDRVVDLSLGLRHHPLELVPAILLYAALAILLGLPVWTALLTEAVMMSAAFWEHLAIRLPAPVRALVEPWIVLPETHLLHHSADRRQTDSNYSTLTIIWDRMFGTFRPSKEAVARIGLGESYDVIADSLWQQLLLPIRQQSSM